MLWQVRSSLMGHHGGLQCETEDARIHGRVQLVADILDGLQETTNRRRSGILAVADVVYDPEMRVDCYAKPLMALEDDTLDGVRNAASC